MRRVVNIVITIIISLGFLLLGYFVFSSSYLRFGETCKEFGESIAFYFCEIFGIEHNIAPGVNAPSEIVGNMITLPDNLDGFKENTQSFFSLFFSGENFVGWWGTVTETLATLSKVLVLLLPCLVGLCFVIKWLYGRINTRHNKDTVPLVVFKFISKCTYSTVEAVRVRIHGFLTRAWLDMEMLGYGVGVPL